MKHLRTLEFKPYVIFIKPPSIERLRETRKNAKIISSRDDQGAAKPFTVSTVMLRETTKWYLGSPVRAGAFGGHGVGDAVVQNVIQTGLYSGAYSLGDGTVTAFCASVSRSSYYID